MGKVTLKVTKSVAVYPLSEWKQAGYVSRLHYFSDWIKDNEQKGIVHERTGELGLAVSQILNLDFMSTHSDNYHRLKIILP